MSRFDGLMWTPAPGGVGWYFVWKGLGGMTIEQIVDLKTGQKTVLGGKNDGAPVIPVDEFGARLWAGPLGIDPHTLPEADRNPPELPESEFYILEELKMRQADGTI